MSEVNNNNAEDLIEDVEYEVDDSPVVPGPIDPTLTQSGVAADAKAVGEAIAAMISKLILNGKTAVANAITLYAGDILMSDADGAQTIAAAIEAAGDKAAADIMYDEANLVTVKDALDQLDTDLTDEEIDTIFESVFGGVE